MEYVTYPIVSWSGKNFKARYNYCCNNCGGVIPKGTRYIRHVVRLGPRKGKDPLQNVQVHLDCEAPWYQPESIHRLKALGNLPGRAPPPELFSNGRYYQKPTVSINTPQLGTLLWQLPEPLATKMLSTPKKHLAESAQIEIEQALNIALLSLIQASGHRKKSMKLNHLIEGLAQQLERTPV